MELDIKSFKGLDLRTSALDKNFASSSDLLNVDLDSDGSLRKRYGYELAASIPAGTVLLVEHKEQNELLAIGIGCWRLESGTFRQITTTPTYTVAPSHAEFNGVIYFTDPNGILDLYKYDGAFMYKAGIPKPVFKATTPTGSSYDYRLAFRFFDYQGNIVLGDYYTVTDKNAGTPAFKTLAEEGYYNKYSRISGVITVSSTAGQNQITTTSHNYLAGDRILIVAVINGYETPLKIRVDSVVTNTKVVLNISDLQAIEQEYGIPSFTIVTTIEGYRISLICFSAETTSLSFFRQWSGGTGSVLNAPSGSITFTLSTPTFSDPFAYPMEDEYDTTIIKGLPPRAKYISFYNSVMVLGHGSINSTAISPNSLNNSINKNSIYWSDVSRGSTVENFSPLDFEIVGKTSDGNITGIYGGPNYLGIFKSKKSYTIDGLLQQKTYRINDSLTPIGCINHKSIVEINGGALFLSERGIYFFNGTDPQETSDLIEPFFTKNLYNLDFNNCFSAMDTKNEKIYFFFKYLSSANGMVLVFDYYFKEWFLWSGINATKGLCVFGDTVYFASDSVYKFNTGYSDNGTAISAYYKSAWITLFRPSLRKKFTDLIAYSFAQQEQTLLIEQGVDWKDAVVENGEIYFDGESTIEHLNTAQNLCNAYRYSISNDTLNEGMSLNGITLKYEGPQTAAKVR